METLTELSKYNNKNSYSFSLKGYEIHGRVLNVVDGDTLTIVLPIFDNKFFKFSVRLDGIDTPEIHSDNPVIKEKALKAKYRLLELICTDKKINELVGITNNEIKKIFDNKIYIIYLQCLDFDKYGRLLAKIYLTKKHTKDLSTILIEEKLAYAYDGGKKLNEEEIKNF
jgi:endonuclease YncB( thermonuclease family)